jgi:hypothetical protein
MPDQATVLEIEIMPVQTKMVSVDNGLLRLVNPIKPGMLTGRRGNAAPPSQHSGFYFKI